MSELVPLSLPEVRRLLWLLLWSRRAELEQVLAWSLWRRRHQRRAQICHYKRRTLIDTS